MKVTNVTKYKATFELSLHKLYRIMEALDVVVDQYPILDKNDLNVGREVYQEVHEDLIDVLVNITDETGEFIPT